MPRQVEGTGAVLIRGCGPGEEIDLFQSVQLRDASENNDPFIIVRYIFILKIYLPILQDWLSKTINFNIYK